MKTKNFMAATLLGLLLLTACNGNTKTNEKSSNSQTSNITDNNSPDDNKSTNDGQSDSDNSIDLNDTIDSESAENSDFKYEFDSELNGMVITEYVGTATEVTIPDTLDGKPVVMIDVGAFAGLDITGVVIPDSVITLDDRVFDYCTQLESVTIGNGLNEIGVCTFHNCMSLTSITIPDSVTKIGDYAFDYCSILTNITIPDSVSEIGYDAFVHCEKINVLYKGTSYDYEHIEDLYTAING